MLEWQDHLGRKQTGAIPDHVRVFVDAIGVEATVKLLMAFGGGITQFAVSKPKPGNRVVATIGLEAALILGREFQGAEQRIPTACKFVARHFKSQGLSVLEIARRLHRADTTIRRYLRGDDA